MRAGLSPIKELASLSRVGRMLAPAPVIRLSADVRGVSVALVMMSVPCGSSRRPDNYGNDAYANLLIDASRDCQDRPGTASSWGCTATIHEPKSPSVWAHLCGQRRQSART